MSIDLPPGCSVTGLELVHQVPFAVGAAPGFSVSIGRGLFRNKRAELSELSEGRTIRAIVDRAAAVRNPDMISALTSLVPKEDILSVKGGEQVKSLGTLSSILDWLDSRSARRRSECLYIVGGGALSDVASLAASLYRRGISFFRFPTTPLSVVDAGVGLKSAINLGSRKNLVGGFAAPVGVWSDLDWLTSVPRRHVSSGLAEVLKIGLALDCAVFEELKTSGPTIVQKGFGREQSADLWVRSVSAMVQHLERDPLELTGPSATDLGHTLSRYFEEALRPRPTHGEAVALEIAWSAGYANYLGLLSSSKYKELLGLMVSLGLPIECVGVDPDLVKRAIRDIEAHRDGPTVVFVPVEEGVRAVPLDINSPFVGAVPNLGRHGGRSLPSGHGK